MSTNINETKKILFISHDATRSGAPIVLLHLLKFLKKNTNYQIDVLVLKDGPLLEKFVAVTNRFYSLLESSIWLNNLTSKLNRPLVKKAVRNIAQWNNKRKLPTQLAKNQYDLIYANTIISIPLAHKIKTLSINSPKLIAHVHELNTLFQLLLPNFASYKKEIDTFIAVSELVKNNLWKNWKVAPKKIVVIYDFSIISSIESSTFLETKVLTIGGSGIVNWRKGADLFLQVARQFKEKYPETKIKFTWVGKILPEQQAFFQADIEKLGLVEVIQFVGEQNNPYNFYQNFDIFLMTSREDPFPLVCIEVGLLGKPILCFQGATGTQEILQNGGGFIVPYLNTEAMVEKIKYYYDHPKSRQKDGTTNKKQFASFSAELICPKILQTIKKVINN